MDDLELKCTVQPDDWVSIKGDGGFVIVDFEVNGPMPRVQLTRPDAARLRDWLTAWLGEG